jgi:hypothetical protein
LRSRWDFRSEAEAEAEREEFRRPQLDPVETILGLDASRLAAILVAARERARSAPPQGPVDLTTCLGSYIPVLSAETRRSMLSSETGHTLMLITRSAQALKRPGFARTSWKDNRTGDDLYECFVSGQLRPNGLDNRGMELP